MKTQKSINSNWVVLALIVGLGYFIYTQLQSDPKAAAPIAEEVMELEQVTTFQHKENDFMHTPENYLIDYYTYLNNREWQKMESISNKRFSAQLLQDTFSHRTVTGFKIIDTTKEGKHIANIKALVTFTSVSGNISTKEINARLELATDYTTWIVSPPTTY